MSTLEESGRAISSSMETAWQHVGDIGEIPRQLNMEHLEERKRRGETISENQASLDAIQDVTEKLHLIALEPDNPEALVDNFTALADGPLASNDTPDISGNGQESGREV